MYKSEGSITDDSMVHLLFTTCNFWYGSNSDTFPQKIRYTKTVYSYDPMQKHFERSFIKIFEKTKKNMKNK